MEFGFTELLVCIVALIGTIFYFKPKRLKNYPPGPTGLPFIGNMLQLGDEPHKKFMELRKTYGDIISFKLGKYNAISLNNYKVIKEALNENAFTGRPKFSFVLERSGGGTSRGLVFSDGHTWIEQRRFTLKNLRDFGFGKKDMESLVHVEIEELIENFVKDIGKPITTQNRFNAAVLNALWSIITGQRYSHDDPRLADLIKRLTSSIQQSKVLSLALVFPFLRKVLPSKLSGSSPNSAENRQKTTEFMTENIADHKTSFQENSPRDFIDVYLSEINKTKDSNSSFFKDEGEKNLTVSMLDLFAAGAETTSTTLTWAFLLLSINSEVQEKLHKEIKKVVGVSRLPSLLDRPKMPFTEAVIMEVMRYSAIVPNAVQHRTTEDVKFHGFDIPKDTLIIPNLYCALRDPEVWGDPDNFRPTRFLSNDEVTLIRHEAFIPFSTGKRVCLGETLARDELFLFMSSLFQRFEVMPNPNAPKPNPNEYFKSVVLIPKPHTLVMRDRFENL